MERDRHHYDVDDELAAERPPRDSGIIGSETEEPGPGRDTTLTDPDPAAASTEQPRTTVAMSDADPERTRLGVQEADAEPIGAGVDVPETARDPQLRDPDRAWERDPLREDELPPARPNRASDDR